MSRDSNVEFANVHCNNNDKKHKKNNKKKIHAIPEIRTRDPWVQSPPRYPLRYGDQCNLSIKIINIC